MSDKPIDMVLFCPRCGVQHIDEPSPGWDNPPHKSHLCAICDCIWRPADVPTNGVASIKTKGTRDNWVEPFATAADQSRGLLFFFRCLDYFFAHYPDDNAELFYHDFTEWARHVELLVAVPYDPATDNGRLADEDGVEAGEEVYRITPSLHLAFRRWQDEHRRKRLKGDW